MRILHRYKKNPCNVQYSIDTGGIEYGLLYNWYAATDERNICNIGWHIPDMSEFAVLYNYLGGSAVAGGKLKEVGLVYWNSPNTEATNETGFNGRAAGVRDINPYPNFYFFNLKYSNELWSSDWTDYGSYEVGDGVDLNYTDGRMDRTSSFKQAGRSIRLVKNSTTLSNGETGAYTGNDGKVYRTICIGTQEWLADNLNETKYRNGDPIPTVEDNVTWAALTTGALCAYNNDWNYVETTSDPNAINYALISGELPITVELIGNTTHTNNHIILESGSFTDIPGGTYTFKVTDALGCEESEIIEIPYSEPIALNSSYDIDRKTLETCTVFKGFDYTVFGFTGETMFDRVKITSVPTNGTLSRGLLDTILVNDELIYPSDFNNGLYYRTSSIEKVDYSDTIGFKVRVNGLWSNTATITINVNSCIFAYDCIEYGYLYNWYAVDDERNIANTGWHVPSYSEWLTMINYLGGMSIAGLHVKINDGSWFESLCYNTSGFNARTAGFRNSYAPSSFINPAGRFHVSNLHSSGEPYWAYLEDSGDDSYNEFSVFPSHQYKSVGFSVRLVKDSTALSDGQTSTYIGNDGKVYRTICIGTQEWVADNLAETQYSNGDPIPTVEDNTTWAGLTTGAKCAYNNNYEYVVCDETGPVPVVTTNAATNIGDTFATLNGEISGDATVTENGFCWGENAFPTKDDNVVVSGSGTGSISDIVESLECPTTYHFRAYAEYSGGIVYGENQQFTITTATLPLFYAFHRYDFQDGNGIVDITGSYQECVDAIAHSKITGMGGWNGTLHRCLGAVVGNQIYSYNGTCVKSISLDGWRVTGTSTASLKIINVLDGLIIEVYDE